MKHVKKAVATDDEGFIFVKTDDGSQLAYIQFDWIVRALHRSGIRYDNIIMQNNIAMAEFLKYLRSNDW